MAREAFLLAVSRWSWKAGGTINAHNLPHGGSFWVLFRGEYANKCADSAVIHGESATVAGFNLGLASRPPKILFRVG